MIGKEHIDFLNKTTKENFSGEKSRYFIFGSSLREENFEDVDLAIIGGSEEKISKLKTSLEESNFPYFVDVVNFDTADKNFIDYVENNEKKLWLNY